MAYCLRSLVQTLEQVLYPHYHHKNWILDHNKIPQIKSLLESASFLRDFLDDSSPQIQERIASLENQIMEAAEKAEDTLESHIANQILSSPKGYKFVISPPDLKEVIQVFKAAKQQLLMFTSDVFQRLGSISHHVSPTRLSSKNVVVGLDDDLNKLKCWLTNRSSQLEILSIVGMGGMGKTTLAQMLYDTLSSSNNLHFDRSAWVTLSENYELGEILRTLLHCVTGEPLNEIPTQNISEMRVNLHKALFNNKYFIVIDDIWSCEAWDDLRNIFTHNYPGSRIILTTRQIIVANYVSSNSHEMRRLNKDESWSLIKTKVFGKEFCPIELEEIGKEIVAKCGGLPLALQIIGEILSLFERSRHEWERVVSTFIGNSNDQFSCIFSRSFTHLPHYLKPCFLYMSTFPDDHDIGASKIIKLWVAEGYLKPNEDKSLEEVAEIYLNALMERNLIFVRKRKKNGKAKSYGICDLLRDMCLRKAQAYKFIHVKHSHTDIFQDDTLCIRRVCVHLPTVDLKDFINLDFPSLTHSYLLIGNSKNYKLGDCVFIKPSLLRVLDMYQVRVREFPEVFLQLVSVRYLAIYTKPCNIPGNISTLKNLQTLIVKYLMSSIAEVLALPLLRHFKLDDLISSQESCDTTIIPHENLQSLSNILLKTLAEYLLGKLPKLRKLGIKCGDYSGDVDLDCFQELETLKCSGGFDLKIGTRIPNIYFPRLLSNLTLHSCGLPKSLLDAISKLSNLQILKLDACRFRYSYWEPRPDGFCELHYLQISCPRNLEKWLATQDHFPVLRHLVMRDCPNLNEIPNDIGEIDTLEIIEVDRCKASVFDSARRLSEEQSALGNTLIQLKFGRAINDNAEVHQNS